MTVADVKKEYEGQYADVEVYRHVSYYIPSNKPQFHTDDINFTEDYTEDSELENDGSYELMDEEDYTHSIDANCEHVPFSKLYDGEDPKVLCIIIK